jgi:hypothetical protein
MSIFTWIIRIFRKRRSNSLRKYPSEFLHNTLAEINAKLRVLDRAGKLDSEETKTLYLKQIQIMSELYRRKRTFSKD